MKFFKIKMNFKVLNLERISQTTRGGFIKIHKLRKIPNPGDKNPETKNKSRSPGFWHFRNFGIFEIFFSGFFQDFQIPIPGISGFFDLFQNKKSHPETNSARQPLKIHCGSHISIDFSLRYIYYGGTFVPPCKNWFSNKFLSLSSKLKNLKNHYSKSC